ncbi:MAG: phytanoyl-CoA dioxygenase family protein [Myxococcota bacterium]|nr:phytanoyl-CoA dioxygenase family protein [Myxococcota bacterium]
MLTDRARELDLSEPLSEFSERGYALLGPVLTDAAAQQLAARAEALMEGEVRYPRMFFQHDAPTGRYEDLVFDEGWVGPSQAYRKLERLELDPLFLAWIENPLFERIAHRVLGQDVRLYRSVLWNKAPRIGMAVPWHQDDGRFWGLDRPPVLQVWTALDDAPRSAGCLEVLPGSHLEGLATREGGTIPPDRLECEGAEARALPLAVRRGESILVHNHTWHRTGRNHTDLPRRALSISFLGGEVSCLRRRRAPRQFQRLFLGQPDHPEDDTTVA